MKEKNPILPAAVFALLVFLLAAAHPAHAHKVMTFAYIEGGRVHVEGYFADGKKLSGSLVEVFDEAGAKILEGKTDSEGVFSFPVPEAARVKIVLTGSMGHRAECLVETGDAAGPGDAAGRFEPAEGSPGDGEPAISDREYLKAVVAREVDRKLSPLRQEISALKEDRPSLTEILGGIGYIFGIMGVIVYFKARSSQGA